MNFIDRCYEKQEAEFSKHIDDPEQRDKALSWFDETTADYWRHARCYECVDCIADAGTARWLTVGDGRWGLDSIRIRKKGVADVLPTDLSETLLRESKSRGFIRGYSVENAERLGFPDDAFDYVFCKEAFHHFPRPYLALYEMLRVARRAVFLVEPNDPTLVDALPYSSRLFKKTFAFFWKRLFTGKKGLVKLGRGVHCRAAGAEPSWEEVGNYVYGISRRDMEKVALGLNLPHIVSKGLNDCYIAGCEFEPADPAASEIFRKIVQTVEQRDRECRAGLGDYQLLMVGMYKIPVDQRSRDAFAGSGWEITDLPRNPHMPPPP